MCVKSGFLGWCDEAAQWKGWCEMQVGCVPPKYAMKSWTQELVNVTFFESKVLEMIKSGMSPNSITGDCLCRRQETDTQREGPVKRAEAGLMHP